VPRSTNHHGSFMDKHEPIYTNDEALGLAGQIAPLTPSVINWVAPGLAGPQLRRLTRRLRASKPAATARRVRAQDSTCRDKWP
jgi:hypothetical protein